MYSRAIHLNNAVLSYDVHGHGSRAILMFHGAGQDRSIFRQLLPEVTSTYRIYAFDLFFHGESRWNNDVPISKNDWTQLLKELCSVEQLEAIAVLGYSIGARFALATLEALPQKVTVCILVAPDGLVSNPWFGMGTGSMVGRQVFKHLMQHPKLLHWLLQVARHFRVIDKSSVRFIEHQLDNEEKRVRILRTWTYFRLLCFEPSALEHVFNSSGSRLVVYLGRRDRIVNNEPVRAFLKRLKSAHLEVIDSNHRRLLNEALKRIAAL